MVVSTDNYFLQDQCRRIHVYQRMFRTNFVRPQEIGEELTEIINKFYTIKFKLNLFWRPGGFLRFFEFVFQP